MRESIEQKLRITLIRTDAIMCVKSTRRVVKITVVAQFVIIVVFQFISLFTNPWGTLIKLNYFFIN